MNKTEIILLEKVKEEGIVRIIIDYKKDLEDIGFFIIQLIDSILKEIIETPLINS